jgi:hypothetical protein
VRPHHTAGRRNTKPPESLPVASLGISISDSLQIGPIVMSEERLCNAAEAKKNPRQVPKSKESSPDRSSLSRRTVNPSPALTAPKSCQPVARNLSRTCPRTCHKFSGGVEIGRRARFRIAKSSISKHRFSFQKTIDLREKNAIFQLSEPRRRPI